MPRVRTIRNGEALAIHQDCIKSGTRGGRRAQWWEWGSQSRPNERVGVDANVAVVRICGPLEHRASWGDSYEAILDRVGKALSGDDVVEQAKREAYWNDDVVVPAAKPPAAVILRIDSPGGVVAGLNETVRKLREMAKRAAIPMVAYVDELAASAAYALACACDEILLPPSAIVGSVGVISTMYDQTAADEKMGLRFVTITSGARKSDGNPHVPMTDDAVAAEQRRVDRFAVQFFGVVEVARGLSRKAVRDLNAGLFIGADGVTSGLADSVMTWDETVEGVSSTFLLADRTKPPVPSLPPKGKSGVPASVPDVAKGEVMLTKLAAIVANLQKKMAAAPAAERAAISARLDAARADLAAATKIKKKVESYEESSESSEESSEEETTPEDDAETESAEDEGDGDEEDGDEEEEAADKGSDSKALLAFAKRVTGKASVGALAAVISEGQRAAATVKKMAAERDAERKATSIDAALGAKRISRAEAKDLRGKSAAFVRDFLSMRKGPIVNGAEDAEKPAADATTPTTRAGANLPADVMREIAHAAAVYPAGKERDEMTAALIDAHQKRIAGANGLPAGGY